VEGFSIAEIFDYSLCRACPKIEKKIDRIDVALLGPDGTGMNAGIVFTITELQKQIRVQDSWVRNATDFRTQSIAQAKQQ
jgi:hypothetical protein